VETLPERATSIPWSWYSDADVLRLEHERIFVRSWQYAGHFGEVPEPGSYFTAIAGQVPLVVTRDREGELNAFVNVCRHRGHPVVSGSGRRETLQCPYHAWTYGLDGSLRAAPRYEREPEFSRETLGLRPVQVDTWGPFVFVNPDLDASPLADTLRDLPDLVAAGGIDVDTLVFRDRIPSRSRLTGRSSARTSSSVTTARSRTRASATWSTSAPTPTCSRRRTRS
jgi:phenylpropionate dioxygenase-like ring-hydroxylating dioxygenase large terminal subunit